MANNGLNGLNLIDEEIRRLQELRRLAENPRMLDLMRSVVNSTSVAPPGGLSVAVPENNWHQPQPKGRFTGLTDAIIGIVNEMTGVFTLRDVDEKLKAHQTLANSAKPSISGVLQRLVERGLIESVERGVAGQPSKYRRVQEAA